MATQALFQEQLTGLNQLVRSWDRRLRIRHTSLWLPRALVPGLTLGILIAVISRLRPFLKPEQIALVSAVLLIVGLVVMVATVWLWPRSNQQSAQRFDRTFGLKERTSTALELIGGRIHSNDELVSLQIGDAWEHAREVQPGAALPLVWNWREWTVVGLLAAALVVLLLIPNPQTAALARNAEQAAEIASAKEEIQETIKQVADDPALKPEEREELLKALQASADILNQPDVTTEEAFATLSDAQTAVQNKANELNQNNAAQQAAMAQAQSALKDFQPGNGQSQSGDSTAQSQDAQASTQTAIQNASNNLQNLTPAQQAALAQALEAAANSLQQTNPQAAQALQQAAQALQNGDTSTAQQQLQQAQEALQQDAQNAQSQQSTAQQLSQNAQNIQQSAQDLSQQANSQSQQSTSQTQQNGQQSGQQSQQSQNQQGQQGQQGNQNQQQAGQQGQQNGQQQADQQSGQQSSNQQGQGQQGSQPGQQNAQQGQNGQQGQGQSASGQGQDGQSGQNAQSGQNSNANSQGQSNPSQSVGGNGAGAGDTPGSTGSDQGGSQAQSGSSAQNNNPDGTGEGQYDAVYAPQRINGQSTDQIELDPNASDNPVQEGNFADNPNGNSTVPYTEVLSDYSNAANVALDSDYIPLGLRDVVKTYFSSLEPGQGTNPSAAP